MAKKSKKNQRNLSEKVAQRKHVPAAKPNLFELKINRQKHEILGRKAKDTQGHPGLARSKAVTKRIETLLPEYKQRGKANKFTDKRLGEYEADITPDEKMQARFAAERMRNHSKGNIFNLNDEEPLTHFGQSLAEIEKFDDPRSDSENEDNLGAEFVKEAHFGGLLTKKEYADEGKDGSKSRKDLIEELIANSKLRKYEKQKERETTLDLTEKLDAEWKNIRRLLPTAKKSEAETAPAPMDDYDLIVRKLKFEQRGKAMDRLKTPEEIAREEKEKLEKLESERLSRMKGGDKEVTSNSQKTVMHCSADDADDGFQLTEEDKYWVSYKDGKLVNDPKPKNQNARNDGTDDEEMDNDKEKESEEEESDGSEEEASDVEESETESESGSMEDEEVAVKENGEELVSQPIVDAASELPFTYEMPSYYEDFMELVEKHSFQDQLIIVDRIIKCHHPCLAEGNREKLEAFYPMLLQLVNDAASQECPNFQLVDGLISYLYDITQFSPVICAQCMLDVILEKQESFHKACSSRASNMTAFPSFDTLIFFKIVSKLFPTSDFQHPVVTPTMLFMGQILTQSTVTRRRDLVGGLFVCSVFLEYSSLSKRFIPEAIGFLRGVYYSALNKMCCQNTVAMPPFKRDGLATHALELQENCSDQSFEAKPFSLLAECSEEPITDQFRLNALHACFNLLYQYAVLYETKPSHTEIFTFFTQNQAHLPTERFPTQLRDNVERFFSQLNKTKLCKRNLLAQAQKKPQPSQQFTPAIQDRFDGRKQRKGSKESLEKQRLVHLHKRELKGAVREMRRDNQFLAKQQLNDQLDRDADRKRKLKELYHDLATQEGNCKAIERVKKSK